MEHFYTLQGEGFHSGVASYFIRLGGCDVGCVWCDVKDSWDASKHPQMNVDDIVSIASENPARVAVITGGEPAMYDLTALCDALHNAGFQTHIETSGAYPIKGALDWVTVSPKKFKAPVDEALAMADELKVVVFNKHDFDWAEQHATKVPDNCKLYLQPEWDKRDSMTTLIIEYIKQHPQWELSLQTHKYINIP
ncbi:MAG: radical SAM protein [Chitinophagales bacterium]|nr:radical SAM protein [Chitinophagaceae bacterium]MCB9065758.1 radical SAM protein [Chitinophagales bacterium]